MASSSLTSFASCILATFEIAQEQHEGTVSFTERKQTPALRFKPGERPLKKLYRAVQQAPSQVTYEAGGRHSRGYGRFYAQSAPSVPFEGEKYARTATAQGVPKWMRAVVHALWNFYVDVSNCLPTLEVQLGEALGIRYPPETLTLRHTLGERLEARKVADALGVAKTVVIQLQNGSGLGPQSKVAKTLEEAKASCEMVRDILEPWHGPFLEARKQLVAKVLIQFRTAVLKGDEYERTRIHRIASVLLQSIERVVMAHLVTFLQEQHDREVTALIHDGVLFAKHTENEEFPAELLEPAQAYIREKTGFSLKLCEEALVVPEAERWRLEADAADEDDTELGEEVSGLPARLHLDAMVRGYFPAWTEQDTPVSILSRRKRGATTYHIIPRSKRLCTHSASPLSIEMTRIGEVREVCASHVCAVHPSAPHGWTPPCLCAMAALFALVEACVDASRADAGEGGVQDPSHLPVSQLDAFNRKFGIVKRAKVPFVFVVDRAWDAASRQPFASFEQAEAEHGGLVALKRSKVRVEWARLWLKHPDANRYDRLVFLPGSAQVLEFKGERVFNTWSGFPYEPVAGDCSKYLTLLRNGICGGVEAQYEYALSWMALAMQQPQHKAQTALVLQGDCGVGKGIVASNFGALHGHGFVHVTSEEHFGGSRFNGHMEHCTFLFVDEGVYAGDKKTASRVKGIVTEPKQMVERKGIDAYLAPSFLRILVATNHDWAVPMERDCRRFVCLSVDSQFRDHPFLHEVRAEMKRDAGRQALMHVLMTRDLSNFREQDFPVCAKALAIKMQDANPAVKFLVAEAKHLVGRDIASRDLFDQFIEEWKRLNANRPSYVDRSKFSKTVKDVLQQGCKKVHTRQGNSFRFGEEGVLVAGMASWFKTTVEIMQAYLDDM